MKAKKTKMLTVWLLVIALLVGCQAAGTASYDISEEELEENQELIYGQIESMTGNEMTLAIVNVTSGSAMGETAGKKSAPSGNGERRDRADMASGSAMGEQKGRDFSQSERGERKNRPDMASGSAMGKPDEALEESSLTYTLTGETREYQIPVGTVVTTSLGAETTFAHLVEGDVIKVLLETTADGESVITGIWIQG